MMKRYAAAALCCWSWTLLAAPAAAQNTELTSRDIIRVLQRPMDMKDFQNPMTLKETLGLLYEKMQTQGVELPFLIDQKAFTVGNAEVGDIYETPVKFPPYPKRMSLASMLEIALSRIPSGDATYVIRRGTITITPAKHAKMEVMLKQKVTGHFEGKYLSTVLDDLAELTGVSIQIDKRVLDKINVQVSATFRNDVSLHSALIVLADMGGVKLVELPSAVYITTADNAAILRDELAKTRSMPKAK